MASWTRVPHDVARQHPLYGVKGWAALLAFALGWSSIRLTYFSISLGVLARPFAMVLLLFGVSAVTLLFALINHRSWFRPAHTAYALALSAGPFVDAVVSSAVAQAHGVPLLASDFITPRMVLEAIVPLVWATYVNLSVRIRVTCEGSVPAAYQPGSPSASPSPGPSRGPGPSLSEIGRYASFDHKPIAADWR